MENGSQTTHKPFYYLDNFQYMLDFVRHKSGHILAEDEKWFINKFKSLPKQARALYVRIFNRKGLYFNADKFNYNEIKVKRALKLLKHQKFISFLVDVVDPEITELLKIFTKEDLIYIYKLCEAPKINKSIGRDQLLECIEAIEPEKLIEQISSNYTIVKQERSDQAEMIKFLFFGSLDFDMTEFVIRDIGNADFENYDENKLSSYFSCRKEAEDKYFISNTYKLYKQKRETEPILEVYNWFKNYNIGEVTEPAKPIFGKLVNKIAYDLERNSLVEEALELYNHTDLHPSRERRVRIYNNLNRIDEAHQLCNEILLQSTEPKEKIFAADFLQRKGRLYKTVTKKLNGATFLEINSGFEGRVEEGVMNYFSSLGFSSFFSENYLWRSLFGLLFWEVIYDEETGTIHNPLQRAPSDIYLPYFFQKRESKINELFRCYNKKSLLRKKIKNTWISKSGKVNPLFGWDEVQLKMVNKLVKYTSPMQLFKILHQMCTNMKSNCTGFPDLFVYNKNEYFFAEVKSPNDHLSEQQLFWLDYFNEVGIPAKILRVKWK